VDIQAKELVVGQGAAQGVGQGAGQGQISVYQHDKVDKNMNRLQYQNHHNHPSHGHATRHNPRRWCVASALISS